MDVASNIAQQLRAIESDVARAAAVSESFEGGVQLLERAMGATSGSAATAAAAAAAAPSPPVLTMLTAAYEARLWVSVTFPASSRLWDTLYEKRRASRGPIRPHLTQHSIRGSGGGKSNSWGCATTQAPSPAATSGAWMIITATHTSAVIVLHAETLREAVLHSCALGHIVVQSSGAVAHGRRFWPTWNPEGHLKAASSASGSNGGSCTSGQRVARVTSAAFPGELLTPMTATNSSGQIAQQQQQQQ